MQKTKVVDQIVQDHTNYRKIYPYRNFAMGSVPGEDALVRRQIYEVLKRRVIEVLDSEKLIFFQNDQAVGSGFKVQFLASYLENRPLF